MSGSREHQPRPGLSPDGAWITDQWSEHVLWSCAVSEVLRDETTAFQRIVVVDTPALGRILMLDGHLQCAERDEAAYHELIVHPGLCRRGAAEPDGGKRVLIIGGGDGGAAREALRHDDVTRVDLCDIDDGVMRAARELMPTVWRRPEGGPLDDDDRFHIHAEDGVKFLEDHDGPGWDQIVVDASDPIGPGAVLYADSFYALLRRRCRDGGAVSVQSGSWWYLPEVLQTVVHGLRKHFAVVEAYECFSAVYPGGVWNLALATTGDDPADVDEVRANQLQGCEWYDAAVHTKAFALPPNARRVVEHAPPALDDVTRKLEGLS